VLQQHLDRIGKNLTYDPAAAIGSSKPGSTVRLPGWGD
jgi:hypothetical protein